MKQQLRENQGWNKIVYDLMTAEGRVYDNPQAGYILRDAGMRLDSLALTATIFLGADVSCAQCHDHPFADWTQKQFYEMTAFFGATQTRKRITNEINLMAEWDQYVKQRDGNSQNANKIRNIIGTNRFNVNQTKKSDLVYPKYSKDIKTEDVDKSVIPKFITWEDVENLELPDPKTTNPSSLRTTFANWLTHPKNPRFAMSMANRLWKRAFGLALNEPVSNIDDLAQSSNPELLQHLATLFVSEDFKIKEFMRILYNTRTYQSKVTTEPLNMGEQYYFQGPLLRRMSAEQAWDSYMTLILGKPEKYKMPLKELQSNAAKLDLTNITIPIIAEKIENLEKNKLARNAFIIGNITEVDDEETLADKPTLPNGFYAFKKMELLPSAELEQPEEPDHFLNHFGQSQRQIIDDSKLIGSIPQILSLMNGDVQQMLTRPKSLILRNILAFESNSERLDALYLSVLNRYPTNQERSFAELSCKGHAGIANVIWALINSREFMFIQ
jgi:hypothetical protein